MDSLSTPAGREHEDLLTPPPPVRRILVDQEPTVVQPPPGSANGHGPIGVASPHRSGAPSRAPAPKVERMRAEEVSIAYGEKLAVDEVTLPVRQGEVLALIGPSGCGKTTLLRSLQPPRRDHPDRGPRRHDLARRRRHRPDGGDRAAAPGQHGLPAAQPVPDERLRQRRLRAARTGLAAAAQGVAAGAGRRRAAPRRPLGRGRLHPRPPGAAPLRRPAAAALHRPRPRRPPRGAAARRALLGARPALHPGDRGADPAPARGGRDRDRHPQHAAGAAGRRPRRLHVPRRAGRVRPRRPGLRRPDASSARASTWEGRSDDAAAPVPGDPRPRRRRPGRDRMRIDPEQERQDRRGTGPGQAGEGAEDQPSAART